jgi:hypothetical protein
MDYQKVYKSLCKRAKDEIENRIEYKNNKIRYYEIHHILPVCMGGEGKKHEWYHDNIVLLTAREHFLAHWLLSRIHTNDSKIQYAFWMMATTNRSEGRESYKPSSRAYEEARIKAMRCRSKDKKGVLLSEETKQKISKANTGKKRTEEDKLKMSESQKKRLVNSFKGKKHTEEAKEKMAKAKLGKKLSDEVKRNMSLAQKNRRKNNINKQ